VQEGLAKLVLQGFQAVIPRRNALVASQKIVLYLLIPMYISQEVTAHLRSAFVNVWLRQSESCTDMLGKDVQPGVHYHGDVGWPHHWEPTSSM
jgi:hypothetical protein